MARGGFRPGAGRKRKTEKNSESKIVVQPAPDGQLIVDDSREGNEPPKRYCGTDAKAFLEDLLTDEYVDVKTKIQISNILLPYQHPRKGEGAGKKELSEERAKSAGRGRFAPSAPPKLAVVK